MIASHRLLMSARQASEQAQRMLAWMRSSKPGRLEICSLIDEVDSAAVAIGRIIEAVDLRPAIGLVGGVGSGKSELLGALVGSSTSPLRAKLANHEASLDILSGVLPPGARASVTLRLTGAEPPAAPVGFPVHLRILGQLDLVKLVFRAHAANVGITAAQAPSARSIAGLFSDVERELRPSALAGLSARDVIELREDANAFDPRSPLLRTLTSTGYWDRLAQVVPRLSEASRTRLVSLLWNEEPALTAIYGLLNGALEKLGHSPHIFCELSSIVVQDPATGRMVPHQSSIAAPETLAGLASALAPVPDATVQVSGRFGGSLALDRSILAAIAVELPLFTAAPMGVVQADADLLMFPGPSPLGVVPSPVTQLPLGRQPDPGSEARGGLDLGSAISFLARAKSAFLLERAVRRHQLAGLVVCIDPQEAPDDALAGAIGDWVDLAQGAEPHHRERVRQGLFVVASRPLDPPGATGRIEVWRQAADDPAVGRWMIEGIGADHDWPGEWTPNRRFESYFALFRPERRMAVPHSDAPLLKLEGAQPAPASEPSGGSIALIGALSAVATQVKRQRQLGLQLAEQRRRLRSRVLRHHLSNDPLEIADWRRQIALIAGSRLRPAAAGGRLRDTGAQQLVHALGVSEAELRAVLETRHYSQNIPGAPPRPAIDGTLPIPDSALENPSNCHDSAAAAVAYWLRAMRQAGRSARFCRHLGVPQTVLQHIIDEIAIGAMRTGLVAEVATALESLPQRAVAGDARDVHFAASAARVIGAYLSGIARSDAATSKFADPHDGEPQAVSAAQGWRADGRRQAAASWARTTGGISWSAAVTRLVEDNIAAAPGLIETVERDRELGDLLAGFASSAFEVEL